MNVRTKVAKRGERIRKEKTICPECLEKFLTRKERIRHQMVAHRSPRPVAKYA